MILPWPLATSVELAHVLRPGSHLRPDSALRTLRDNGLAAEPISVVPRSARGAHGRVVWYSSLMIDVARLFRNGDEATAGALVAEANKLAGKRAAHFVAEHLLAAGDEPDAVALDAEAGGALTRLGLLTAAVRQDHDDALGVDSFAGRVAETSTGGIVVTTEEGGQLMILGDSGHAVGDLVAVDAELLAGGITIWVRRAFETETDPHGNVPGGARLLTSAQRARIDRELTSAG